MSEEKIINISMLEMLRALKKDIRILSAFAIIFGIIGVVFAFATPKFYKATVMLAPEESGSSLAGNLSSMAEMVGMTMRIGQTGDALYPEIYPDLMQSTDFIVGLFPVKVTTNKEGKTFDYYQYLSKHQKIAFYEYPQIKLSELLQKKEVGKSDGKVNPFRLTREEAGIAKKIRANVSCQVDKKTNVISITVTDQDPLIAATLADTVKQHLQVNITNYRTKKARVDLKYMESLFAEARKQYDKARQTYASYSDAHQDMVLQSYKLKEADLENDMQLKYNIYQQVMEQLQLSKAKVQERTPAFTVIQSASVPIKHSNRPKIVTLIIWMTLGVIVRSIILVWKNRKKIINLD